MRNFISTDHSDLFLAFYLQFALRPLELLPVDQRVVFAAVAVFSVRPTPFGQSVLVIGRVPLSRSDRSPAS